MSDPLLRLHIGTSDAQVSGLTGRTSFAVELLFEGQRQPMAVAVDQVTVQRVGAARSWVTLDVPYRRIYNGLMVPPLTGVIISAGEERQLIGSAEVRDLHIELPEAGGASLALTDPNEFTFAFCNDLTRHVGLDVAWRTPTIDGHNPVLLTAPDGCEASPRKRAGVELQVLREEVNGYVRSAPIAPDSYIDAAIHARVASERVTPGMLERPDVTLIDNLARAAMVAGGKDLRALSQPWAEPTPQAMQLREAMYKAVAFSGVAARVHGEPTVSGVEGSDTLVSEEFLDDAYQAVVHGEEVPHWRMLEKIDTKVRSALNAVVREIEALPSLVPTSDLGLTR